MKYNTLLLLLASPLLHAGTPEIPIPPEKPAEPWLKPIVDIRLRYDFAEADNLDASHGLTVRERIGLKTGTFYGFSALVEGEFTQALIDDFHAGAPGAEPFDPANTVIIAPNSTELNQAYLQYSAFKTAVRAGRQRIIYDNAAFVGNVGWRQNEQTYDGYSLTSTFVDGLTFNYAYINQVNRIFGSEADGIFENVESNVHLFNASYTGFKPVTLGGYVYLMDFENPDGWDNDTFGLSAKGKIWDVTLYGEGAFQSSAGANNMEEAWYAHVTATKTFGQHSVTLGLEHLDEGFQTPLSTVHLFNGFSDVFNTRRIAGTLPGLNDLYLSHTMPIFCGIKWTNVIHVFGEDGVSADLGYEYDSVLVKKFDEHFTALAKFAHFESEDDLFPTTTRLSVELTYTF